MFPGAAVEDEPGIAWRGHGLDLQHGVAVERAVSAQPGAHSQGGKGNSVCPPGRSRAMLVGGRDAFSTRVMAAPVVVYRPVASTWRSPAWSRADRQLSMVTDSRGVSVLRTTVRSSCTGGELARSVPGLGTSTLDAAGWP